MNLIDVHDRFATEEACIQHLVNIRWPHGVRCVACNSDWVARYDSHGKTGKFRRVYECNECHKQFTAQSGTLFHDSHLPLQKWFMAIALICESKKGMSANQLSRALGVTYKTAWYLAHRIREAMQDGGFLSGIVEMDENVCRRQTQRQRRLGRSPEQNSCNRHERAWRQTQVHQG